MILPTPTPIANASEALINITAAEFRIWRFAPDIVQYWNYANREFSAGLVIQIAVITVMIIALVPLVMRWAAWIDKSNDEVGKDD